MLKVQGSPRIIPVLADHLTYPDLFLYDEYATEAWIPVDWENKNKYDFPFEGGMDGCH